MADRKNLINNLAVGDIFHARTPNGASCICLVLSVDDAAIHARRVTTQEHLVFARGTGVEISDNEQSLATINSVTPLPPEIHRIFLEMDKKNAELMAMDEKSRFADLERLKLSEAEQKALVFIHAHYNSNSLPPLGP